MLTGAMTQGSRKLQGDSPSLNMNEMEDTHEEFEMDTSCPQASKAGTTNNQYQALVEEEEAEDDWMLLAKDR